MSIVDIKLSHKAIEEFRRIWKEEFGEEIPYERAEIRGKELVRLFNVIYRPIPFHNHDMHYEKRKEDLPSEAKSAKEEKSYQEP